MAKAEQLKIIIQGNSVWNDWRRFNLKIKPDLSGADLNGMDLIDVNFFQVDLSDTDLSDADLNKANLSDADLSEANLNRAGLSRANLSRANLLGANLSGADLSDADLSDTDLSDTDLYAANLSRADLSGADLMFANMVNTVTLETKFDKSRFGYTIIADCDLRNALGLHMVIHQGPSSIGIDSFNRSGGKISLTFLKGCGIDQDIAEYLLKEARIKMHYSCFISYSSKDERFAKKLKNDLELKNIKCWFFPEDATWGTDTYKSISLAIKTHDKLIIICSKNSLNSEPVLREIERAIQEEKARKEKDKETERVLFPITIDNYLFNEWEHYLKPDLLKITIGDFRNWKDLKEYNKALLRLVKALQKK